MSHPPGWAEAEWVSRLVRIASVNPAHAGPRAGVPGELAVALALAGWLRDVGATWVRLVDTPGAPDRPNVYALFAGEADRWLGLDVHLDTVGVEHMTDDPFDGRLADGRVWGRGSVETKAGMGVMLAVLERMRRDGRRPAANVIVAGTVSEEAGGLLGARAFRSWLRDEGIVLDELIVAEPTMCAPVYGHKGGVGVEITVRGRACHSAKPELGVNAIDAAADIIAAFRDEHRRLLSAMPTSALGLGTLATTLVSGGTARNIVPDSATISASRRLVPGEDPKAVYEGLVALARRAAAGVAIESVYTPGMPAFYRSPDSRLCSRVASWSGRAPDVALLGTNAFAYDDIAAGPHPAQDPMAREIIVFGPGSIDQAFGAQEWCECSELALAASVFERWISDAEIRK